MKKLFVVLFALACIFLAGTLHASPFLVCDPQPDATHYVVVFDGVEETIPYNTDYPGGLVILKDLTGIADGPHNVEVWAKNIWGLSDPVPFSFSKERPSPAVGISIVE